MNIDNPIFIYIELIMAIFYIIITIYAIKNKSKWDGIFYGFMSIIFILLLIWDINRLYGF